MLWSFLSPVQSLMLMSNRSMGKKAVSRNFEKTKNLFNICELAIIVCTFVWNLADLNQVIRSCEQSFVDHHQPATPALSKLPYPVSFRPSVQSISSDPAISQEILSDRMSHCFSLLRFIWWQSHPLFVAFLS